MKAKTATQAKKPAPHVKRTTLAKAANATLTAIEDAQSHLTLALAALQKAGLATLTPQQRKDSNGKLRQGETSAMSNVLDTIDAYPPVFTSLADKDGGSDDNAVETGPARDHIALWEALAPLSATTATIEQILSDGLLTAAEGGKDVTVPAYGIIKVNAPQNAKLAKTAAPALTFYGAAARTRLANKKRAAKKTTPSSG